jgi:hypothetical protein
MARFKASVPPAARTILEESLTPRSPATAARQASSAPASSPFALPAAAGDSSSAALTASATPGALGYAVAALFR